MNTTNEDVLVETERSNEKVAFGMVLGAGAATALGATVVFFPFMVVHYANRKNLAAALGFSAGVMTYVSFVEIFPESQTHLEKAGFSETEATIYSTIFFFAGVILMLALNLLVTKLLGGQHVHRASGREHCRRWHHRRERKNIHATQESHPTTSFPPPHDHDHEHDHEHDQHFDHEHEHRRHHHHIHNDFERRHHHHKENHHFDKGVAAVSSAADDEENRAQPPCCSNSNKHLEEGTTATYPISMNKEVKTEFSCDGCTRCCQEDHTSEDELIPVQLQPTVARVFPACPCHSDDPAAQLRRYQRMAQEIQDYEQSAQQPWEGHDRSSNPATNKNNNDDSSSSRHHSHETNLDFVEGADKKVSSSSPLPAGEENQYSERAKGQSGYDHNDNHDEENSSIDNEAKAAKNARAGTLPPDEAKKMIRMGMDTALAIALHNFPEGLATFVASLSNTKVGAVLAIAIAIHNIPEGLCVALPIYYATGNRWKGFWWAVLSGLAEPAAALLGWAVLENDISSTFYGVLFGVVGGMMIVIPMRELLPTAHRYDPEDSVATYSFLTGMMIMALSLELFLL